MPVDIEELPGASGRGQVPHTHALVIADRDQKLAIGMEADVRHPIIMPNQCGNTLFSFDVPHLDRLVATSRR